MRDHPRGCGAHDFGVMKTQTPSGSSPRVRGSPFKMFDTSGFVGIIPAGAGLTVTVSPAQKGKRDHPRGCGAHSKAFARTYDASGSSPRVRGSLFAASMFFVLDGIIPAGAGLTRGSSAYHLPTRDHPRGCGAHLTARWGRFNEQGSSPRVRGSQERGHKPPT